MSKFKFYFIVLLFALFLLPGARAFAGEPKYTYEQVYDGRRSSRRFIVLDQTGFQLTTLLKKVFAPQAGPTESKHLQHIHPSFWASPGRGAVGFQSVFQF